MLDRAARSTLALALIAVAAVASAPSALATDMSRSPLPGYPRFHGVVLVRDGSAAGVEREKSIESALQHAISSSTHSTGVSSGATTPDCATEEVNPGADLCYWGGPVLRGHTVRLIFWEGPKPLPAEVEAFSAPYVEAVERYFERVASADNSSTNVYAVGAQYGSEPAGAGRYEAHFSKAEDVYLDTEHELPAAGSASGKCKDLAAAASVCITDGDLQSEVSAALAKKSWPASTEDIYFVLTPPKVGSCFGSEGSAGNSCAFEEGGYCAYHSSFEVAKEGVAPLYANIPDVGNVEGCDSGEHPNGAGGVDATLDVVSHEHNETITDPFGNGWHDLIGQEVGDKCLPPETFDTYGRSLGGSLGFGSAFNQLIGGGKYWLQTEWSNDATPGEGRCVQRPVPAAFAEPAGAKATVPATFDGSTSGEASDPATYWVWNFGDGIQVGTPEASVSHTYALAGTYTVSLTVYDAYGNSSMIAQVVQVGAAPPPPPPPASTTTTTTTTTVTASASSVHYNATKIAKLLGLPHSGAKLSGLGTISLGHAKCPPACGVSVTLITSTREGKHVKHLQIGSLSTKIANKGTGGVALKLTKQGLALLHRKHTLTVEMTVVVENAEGASWKIERPLTLTGAGKAARRAVVGRRG